MRQRWDDLFFFHWRVDPTEVQRRLPRGVALLRHRQGFKKAITPVGNVVAQQGAIKLGMTLFAFFQRHGHGAGDRRALLLASRECVWVAVSELAKADDTQRALHRHPNLFCWSAGDLQREGGVLTHGASLQETEVLEDHANASTQVWHLTRWKIVNRVAGYVHLSSEREHVAH